MSFKCNDCGHSFNSRAKLEYHKNRIIPCVEQKEDIDGKVQCSFCLNYYYNISNLNRHLITCPDKNDSTRLLQIIEEKNQEIENKHKTIERQDKQLKKLIPNVSNKSDEESTEYDSFDDPDDLSDDLGHDESPEDFVSEDIETLKNNNYLYIIKEREFINSNENIYKIGHTTKGYVKRMKSYPKNSVVIFVIKVPNSSEYEKYVIKEFNKIFKRRKDIGSEYYEGDESRMIQKMTKSVLFLKKK